MGDYALGRLVELIVKSNVKCFIISYNLNFIELKIVLSFLYKIMVLTKHFYFIIIQMSKDFYFVD